ncbi:tetratricopeptide repeat protein, partial [Klebsiella pneumoniae]|uniref:tetratricopeptide repeat protein n=1 Tax=Klebsiella pneumoniae TaxID=573 RepID=UPI003F23686C
LGEAESRAGQAAQANSRFEQLLREHPNSRPVALTYAEILNEQGNPDAGKRAQAMLRPLLSPTGNQTGFHQRKAPAPELAGGRG